MHGCFARKATSRMDKAAETTKIAPPPEAGKTLEDITPKRGRKRGLSLLDFGLRILAAAGTLGSAIAMGTTNETQALQFFTQFIQIQAEYNDLPTFTFFVIANSVACGYVVLSLPLSIFHVFKSAATKSRVVLLILDTVMLALVTAGASAATAIVYLAHEGNASANWGAICAQLDSFCKRISGSLIGSFGAVIVFMLIIMTTALMISRR